MDCPNYRVKLLLRAVLTGLAIGALALAFGFIRDTLGFQVTSSVLDGSFIPRLTLQILYAVFGVIVVFIVTRQKWTK